MMPLACSSRLPKAALSAGLLSLYLAMVVVPGAAAWAEERGQDSPAAAATAEARLSPTDAAGDEKAQFKHSAAVRYLARKTGISLERAYGLGLLLNFAIVGGIIGWLSRKHLPEAFRNRTFSIQKALQEARRASADAGRRLAEIESRLSRLDAEIAGMQAAAEKQAVAEDERSQTAAEQEVRRIVESAELEIVAAAKSVRRELTTYAADLAVSLARQRIQVDGAADQALVRGFAQQLGGKDLT